jgi:hypothetical protein
MLRRTLFHRDLQRLPHRGGGLGRMNPQQQASRTHKVNSRNYHEAHEALGSEMYSSSSSNSMTSHRDASKGRSNQQHGGKSNERPAPPWKLPMLMNIVRACPPGWGGTALCPQKRFDGLRIVAAAYRAHEKILLNKMSKERQQPNKKRDDAAENGSASSSASTNYMYYDDQVMVVPDAFPKSSFHFLVLPRIASKDAEKKAPKVENVSAPLMSIAEARPEHIALLRRMDAVCTELVKALYATPEINIDSAAQLERILRLGREAEGAADNEDADDDDGGTDNNSMDLSDYNGVPQQFLRQWLTRPRSDARLRQMLLQQQQQKQKLLSGSSSSSSSPPSSSMPRFPPVSKLKFMSGFHSRPSLAPLHMHITSLDLISDCLKNKKHYNSFTTGFFLSRAFVEEQLSQHGYVKRAVDAAGIEELERLESQSLQCVWCKAPAASIPELKEHLVKCSNNGCYFV